MDPREDQDGVRNDPGVPMAGALGDLTEILRHVLGEMPRHRDPRPPQVKLHTPKFNGEGDVEDFIQQFLDVARTADWAEEVILLQLRGALQDSAKGCGRKATVREMLEALRLRFGLTTREARYKLTVLRREPRVALQQHAEEVERLTNAAYEDLPANHRERLTFDTFLSTLNNTGLQKYLSARQVETVEDAIRGGNEYFQISTTSTYRQQSARQIDVEEAEDNSPPKKAQPIRTVDTKEPMADILAKLTQLTLQMEGQTAMLKQRRETREKKAWQRDETTGEPRACWNCGEIGHFRADCPKPRMAPNASGSR